MVTEIFWGDGGTAAAVRVARERRERWFDPALVDTLDAFEHDRTFWDGLIEAVTSVAGARGGAAGRRSVQDYRCPLAISPIMSG